MCSIRVEGKWKRFFPTKCKIVTLGGVFPLLSSLFPLRPAAEDYFLFIYLFFLRRFIHGSSVNSAKVV